MKLDLRPRCGYCRKIPRGKLREAEFREYQPYCSFHCQEMGRMRDNLAYAAQVARQAGLD